jgi:hypothetical protein
VYRNKPFVFIAAVCVSLGSLIGITPAPAIATGTETGTKRRQLLHLRHVPFAQ